MSQKVTAKSNPSESNIPQILIGSKKGFFYEMLCKLGTQEDTINEEKLTSENFEQEIINLSTKLNVILIKPKSGKNKIGIEDVAPLFDFAYQKPNLGDKSYCIFPEAERLTIEAQNKLLKILEEPPYYLHIYLHCHKNNEEKLLITLRSRCVSSNVAGHYQDELPFSAEVQPILEEFLDKNRAGDGYQNLAALIEKQKVSIEKVKVINTFIALLDKEINAQLNHALETNNQSLVKALQTWQNMNVKLNKAIQRNVPPKLLVDYIFLEFVN